MQSVEMLEQSVIEWAKAKGIPLVPDNALKQMNKTQEELSELRDEIIKEDIESDGVDDIKMELGDVLVTLLLQAAIWETNLSECLELALNKISKRTGVVKNGIFIKD